MRHGRSESSRLRRALSALGAIAAWFGALAAPAVAQSPARNAALGSEEQLATPSNACCLTLLLPVGARAAGLGEALTATSAPDAVFYNPAGLAELEDNVFVLHHVANAIQQVDAFSLVIQPFGLATFALSYELVDYGDEEATDVDGIVIGRITLRDHIVVASFATGIVSGVSAGLNYKLYNARWTCSGGCDGTDFIAWTHGLDVGVQYAPTWLPSFRVGAALLNAGFPLQVVNRRQSDPMPTRLHVGVQYNVLRHFDQVGPYELRLLVDAEDDDWKTPTSPTASAGMELAVADALFLRAGYGGGEGAEAGPSVGVGIVYDQFDVAVAKRFGGLEGSTGEEPLHLSLGVRF